MNLTRLEWRVLSALRKARRPVTAATLEITLDRRVEAALKALLAAGLIVIVRNAYRAAPAPVATEKTRFIVVEVGYADGYGLENNGPARHNAKATRNSSEPWC